MTSTIKIPAAIARAAEGSAAGDSVAPAGARTRTDELRINEIFYSLQGESSRVGLPTVFVRLTGCPLRCGYCDTAYAFHEGQTRRLVGVLAEVASYDTRYVCVTGGEPLAQRNCLRLLSSLCDAGYSVSLETSGAIDISGVDGRVSRIMDIKTPGSGEMEKTLWKNIELLTGHDEIKFVITGEDDYLWARELLYARKLNDICPVLFSPSFADLAAMQLSEWVLRDRLAVRMQVQLHKVIWGEKRGV
jgi:7-carboxy-7-deazaguanine synthase